jgi:LmeA-like phospholipid-binding
VLSVALISVAAVAVTLAGADRLLALIAVRRVSRHLATRLHATSAPVVRIAGVPFVTQVLSGVYRQVDVTVAACRARGLEFLGLTASLSRVRAPLRLMAASSGLVAGEVRAMATIPLSAIGDRLPPGLVLRRQGAEIAVSGFVLLMPVSGTLAIRADRQRICVVPKVLGVPSLIGFVIALPGLPPRLTIDTVDVTDAGLEITMRGEDIELGPG